MIINLFGQEISTIISHHYKIKCLGVLLLIIHLILFIAKDKNYN